MLSDKWLLIYGLLGNFEGEIPHFADVLHFDLQLNPRTYMDPGVECHRFMANPAGTYSPSMNAFL